MSDDLKFKLELDSSQFDSSAKGATSSFGGIKAAIASGIGAATGMGAITLATTAITKGADLAAASLSKVTEFLKSCSSEAGEMELVTARLKSFTTSASEAKEVSKQLAQFASTPPFGAADAEAAARSLLASGTAVKNLTSELTVIGNVSAAANIPLAELAKKYALVGQTGVMTMEQIQNLTEGGLPAWEALSRAMDKPIGKVKVLLAEGRVSFGSYKGMLNELAGEGKKFGKAMDEVCDTLPGKIMVLEGKWGLLKQKIGAKVNDVISPMMDDINDAMDRVITGTAAGLEILHSAFAQGKLGDMMGAAFRVAMGESINYGIGGIRYMASMLEAGVISFGVGLASIMSPGFIGENFKKAMKGGITVLTEGLTQAALNYASIMLNVPRSLLIGLGVAVDKMAATLTPTPRKAKSIEEIAREVDESYPSFGKMQKVLATKINDSKSRSDVATEEVKEGTDFVAPWINTMSSVFSAKMADVKFQPSNLVNTQKDLDIIKKGAEAVNPEALQKFLAAVSGGKTEEIKKKAQLAGASADLQALAYDKAAAAAANLAKKLTEAAIISARANGEHQKAAKLEYKKKFDEKVKSYKEENYMSDREAKFRANEDLKNEARMNQRMNRPREKERQERADKLVEKKVAQTGMIGLFEEASKKWSGGSLIAKRGSLIPDRGALIPTRIRTDIAPLRPAEARKEEQSSLKENVASILKEIVGISAGLKTINVVN